MAAKVTLFKVAPNVYNDLYDEEEPPKDESIPGNEAKETPVVQKSSKKISLQQMEIPENNQSLNQMSTEDVNEALKKIHSQGISSDEEITIGGSEIL